LKNSTNFSKYLHHYIACYYLDTHQYLDLFAIFLENAPFS